jgi:thymidylate synthase
MEKKNNLDSQYTKLLEDILENSTKKQTRNGETISVFGRQIRHKMSEGFPLLTTKRMPFKTIVTELLWFLRGDTNIKYLVDNNCHIWDGDAYKNYVNTPFNLRGPKGKDSVADYELVRDITSYVDLTQEEFIERIKTDDEFAKKWGELGPIYGAGWRNWNSITKKWWSDPEYQGYGSDSRSGWEYNETQIDQIQNLINDLKTNPDSRRLMVNAWAVQDLPNMVLPPCHYGFQVYTRELSLTERRDLVTLEKYESVYNGGDSRNTLSHSEIDQWGYPTRAISLMWNQRSCDTFLGLPFNIASYGLLLEIIAKEVNMVPDELIGNLGDVHLYSNHIEQAKEQIGKYYTIEERVALIPEGVLSQESVEYFNLNKRTNSEINVALAKYNISPGLHTRQPFPLPTFDCPAMDEIPHTTFDELVFKLQPEDFYMDDYQSHPTIKAPLSN